VQFAGHPISQFTAFPAFLSNTLSNEPRKQKGRAKEEQKEVEKWTTLQHQDHPSTRQPRTA